MMPLPQVIHLEVAIPRLLWERWGDATRAQAALQQLGVWPVSAHPLARWRLDHARAWYVVELEVSVPVPEEQS